jgi:hypothetical protein
MQRANLGPSRAADGLDVSGSSVRIRQMAQRMEGRRMVLCATVVVLAAGGEAGIFLRNFGIQQESGRAVRAVVDRDGQAIVLASSDAFSLTRLRSDGGVDRRFGQNGFSVGAFGSESASTRRSATAAL